MSAYYVPDNVLRILYESYIIMTIILWEAKQLA